MLKAINEEVITVNGRTALGLLAAEHVLPLLAALPLLQKLAQEALSADWNWMERRSPDPGKLYWEFVPKIMEEDSRLRNDSILPVLHCVLYAHYYAIWSAEGVTNLEQPGTILSIGNDISEVDESYLAQCLATAVKVSPRTQQTEDWLNNLVALMERTQRKTSDDVIGPPLKRSDFEVPPI